MKADGAPVGGGAGKPRKKGRYQTAKGKKKGEVLSGKQGNATKSTT